MSQRRGLRVTARSYATHVKLPSLLPTTPSTSTPTPGPPRPTSTPSTIPRPRLDYNCLLSSPELTTQNHLARKSPLPLRHNHVPHLKRLRDTQLVLLQKLDTIRARQKELSEIIKHNLSDRDEAVRQAKKLKTRVGEYEFNLVDTEAELLELGLLLPNFSHPSSPIGSEEHAVEIERSGPEPRETDPNRDHLRIANRLGWLDNEASTTATGSSWPYLKGASSLLEQALINHALSIAVQHGFTPVSPPDVIRTDLAWRCGFQPRDPTYGASQTYHLQTEDGSPELCLAGTAEIPLAGLFANRVFNHGDLPKKVVGVGRAFRAEAGARGADTRGLYRVHQFTKVELFAVTANGESEDMMEEIGRVQREIAKGLGLTVRILEMPTEELGASASRKWDMEAWMPGRGKWGEITSTSNCTDYQARRLHIRYKSHPHSQPPTSGLSFAHTLNGTAAAIPRLLVALVENGARLSEKGEFEGLDLPVALQRWYVGGDMVGEGRDTGSIRWV